MRLRKALARALVPDDVALMRVRELEHDLEHAKKQLSEAGLSFRCQVVPYRQLKSDLALAIELLKRLQWTDSYEDRDAARVFIEEIQRRDG